MVICLERGADLHMAQLMPLPLTVSCFSEIQIGFTFLVPAHQGSPGQRVVKRVCVCVCCEGCQDVPMQFFAILVWTLVDLSFQRCYADRCGGAVPPSSSAGSCRSGAERRRSGARHSQWNCSDAAGRRARRRLRTGTAGDGREYNKLLHY